MTKKQLRQEELCKVGRGLLCFLTPHALNAILAVLYANTLASQVLALYLVTALVIVWVLLRPGYLIVAITLLLQSFFFASECIAIKIDPMTMTRDKFYFYETGGLLLSQSSAISGALVLIGGFIYHWWKRRIKQ